MLPTSRPRCTPARGRRRSRVPAEPGFLRNLHDSPHWPRASSDRPTTAMSPSLGKIVEAINAFEPTIAALSDEELAARPMRFRQRLADGAKLDDLLPEAFATVREAAKRTLGQRHYDVQMIGGIALHRGEIAEMKTGEGKTLVATLAVYLNALPGKGVHVVTVNDYLARRDADWMGQIYRFLGLTVGVIVPNLIDQQRRDAYNADITYATNNELGFDYLRDNMKYSRDQMVQRPFNFAIVDEVDSILIDEARTPLIISGPTDDKSELYVGVDAIVKQFGDADYELDEKQKSVVLTEEGTEKAERMLEEAGLIEGQNLYDIANTQTVHHLNQSLKANKHVQEGHRLHRQGRQDRHHRRVHRPDDGRPALVGRPSPGGRGQGRGQHRAREPDPRLDHLPELFPHVSQAVGDDRHGADRSARILRHLQDERRVDPDQRRRQADRRGRRILQEHHRQVPGHRQGNPQAPGHRPAGAGRHRQHREIGNAERISRAGGHQARGAQRPLPRERGAYRRAGRAHGRGDHRHQHGRPRHRHPAGRQHRLPGRG